MYHFGTLICDPTIFIVPYHSEETDCNEWDVVGKVNTCALYNDMIRDATQWWYPEKTGEIPDVFKKYSIWQSSKPFSEEFSPFKEFDAN